MTNELLFNAFSHLDDDLIERSERPVRAVWGGAVKAAACVALLLTLLIAPPIVARRNRPAATPSVETTAPDLVQMGPAQGIGESGPTTEPTPMIESYPLNMEACYAAPKNGEAGFSMPLRAAMDEYGDAARYRVIVDLFRDERPLAADGAESAAERERIADLGYIVAYETLTDADGWTRSYFTLHATYDQLKAFPSDTSYGYMLFLYGEREKSAAPAPVWYGAPQLSTGSVPMDSVDFP